MGEDICVEEQKRRKENKTEDGMHDDLIVQGWLCLQIEVFAFRDEIFG